MSRALQAVLCLDATSSPLSDTSSSAHSHFPWELSAFLKELQCHSHCKHWI